MMISDISGVIAPDTFERPIYAGNAIQTVKSEDPIKVITVRTAAFDATGVGNSAPVSSIFASAGDPELSEWIEDRVAANDRPELTSAKVVVSGGRGVGSTEDFEFNLVPCGQTRCRRRRIKGGGGLRLCPE